MDTDIGALTVIFTEFYYWVTVPLMFLIHVGFCMYEVGASRTKNMMHTLMKNTMLIPLVTITFFFFVGGFFALLVRLEDWLSFSGLKPPSASRSST